MPSVVPDECIFGLQKQAQVFLLHFQRQLTIPCRHPTEDQKLMLVIQELLGCLIIATNFPNWKIYKCLSNCLSFLTHQDTEYFVSKNTAQLLLSINSKTPLSYMHYSFLVRRHSGLKHLVSYSKIQHTKKMR